MSYESQLDAQIAAAEAAEAAQSVQVTTEPAKAIEPTVTEPIGSAQPQANNGDDELRQLLAQRDAELAELRANVKPVDPEPISLYESDERELLSQSLGEDIVEVLEKAQRRSLSNVQSKATERVSLLEQEANNLKSAQARAEFIRAVPKGVMETFNSKEFQDFAKSERLGRKTLADELNSLVAENDVTNTEFLIERVKGFQAGKQAIRKAQLPNGVSPAVGGTQTAAFDLAEAKKLQRDIDRYPPSDPRHQKALDQFDAYMALS